MPFYCVIFSLWNWTVTLFILSSSTAAAFGKEHFTGGGGDCVCIWYSRMVDILWHTSNFSKHSGLGGGGSDGVLVCTGALTEMWLTIWEAIYEIDMDPQLISVHIFRFSPFILFFFQALADCQQIYCSMKAWGPKAWNIASLCLLTCFIYEAQIKDTDCQGSETAPSNNTLCLWQGLFASDCRSLGNRVPLFWEFNFIEACPFSVQDLPRWWIFCRVGAVKSVAMPEYTLVIYFLFSLC